MTPPNLPFEIPESERTPLVNWLLHLIAQQQEVIEKQQETIALLEEKATQLEGKVGSLESELKAAKKLPGKPQILPEHVEPRGKVAQARRETTRFRQAQQKDRLCGR